MKAKYVPLLGTCAIVIATCLKPVWAQLPPTNMGPWVRQPGDNQYSVGTQMKRHGGSGYIDTGGRGSVFVKPSQVSPAPRQTQRSTAIGGSSSGPRTDVSLEPIAADEPIPPPGFPPLPERLDLPVAQGAGWGKELLKRSSSSASNSNNSNGPARPVGYHQHYAHYLPGAFASNKNGESSSTVGNDSSNETEIGAVPGVDDGGGSVRDNSRADNRVAASGGSVGYYKVRTPAPAGRAGDLYSANSSAPTGAQAKGAATATGAGNELKRLGKPPELDSRQEANASAPAVPTPLIVNQSTTQDLSLPDDEFSSRYFGDGKAKRFMRRVVRRGTSYGRSMLRRVSPIGF